MDLPDLYVLRHGETEWNAAQRIQGHLNSALTPKGEAQARAQGALLAGVDLAAFDLISSPLGRAFQTAALALGDRAVEIRTDAALREIGMGAWSGAYHEGLLPDGIDPQNSPDGPLALYEHAPGGEGFAALRARCETFLAGVSQPSVIVTHGITSRMLRAVALGVATADLHSLPGGQGIVFHLSGGVQKILR